MKMNWISYGLFDDSTQLKLYTHFITYHLYATIYNISILRVHNEDILGDASSMVVTLLKHLGSNVLFQISRKYGYFKANFTKS